MKTKKSIIALTKAFFILLIMCCFSSCDGDAVILKKQGYSIKVDTIYKYKIRTTNGYYSTIENNSKLEIKDTIQYGF